MFGLFATRQNSIYSGKSMLRPVRAKVFAAKIFALALFAFCLPESQATDKLPTLAEVKAIVETQLRARTDYAPGDLISRQEVEPIFNELISRGVPLMDGQEELYDDFVPEKSRLVRMLRTPEGIAFMHQVKT